MEEELYLVMDWWPDEGYEVGCHNITQDRAYKYVQLIRAAGRRARAVKQTAKHKRELSEHCPECKADIRKNDWAIEIGEA